jgi:hypothetical protein
MYTPYQQQEFCLEHASHTCVVNPLDLSSDYLLGHPQFSLKSNVNFHRIWKCLLLRCNTNKRVLNMLATVFHICCNVLCVYFLLLYFSKCYDTTESSPFCQDLCHWKEHKKIVRYVKFERSTSSLSQVMIF